MGFKVVPANKTVNRKWLHKNGVDFREWARQNKEEFAERMRNSPTEAEQKMWSVLRGGFAGYTWEAQKVVRGYIPDFFCEALSLAVEVDGGIHRRRKQQSHDRKRTRILSRYGVTVIRVTNESVMGNIEGALRRIRVKVEELKRGKLAQRMSEGAEVYGD